MIDIEFDNGLVTPILEGNKDCTVRYAPSTNYRAGVSCRLFDEDGTIFAAGTVTHVATTTVEGAIDTIEEWDGQHHQDTPSALAQALAGYYPDAEITVETPVTVVKFDVDGVEP